MNQTKRELFFQLFDEIIMEDDEKGNLPEFRDVIKSKLNIINGLLEPKK